MSAEKATVTGGQAVRPDTSLDHSTRSQNLQQHENLITWNRQNGGFIHGDVTLTFQDGKGFHAVVSAGKSIPAETRIASCPMSTTMSALNALNIEPFSNRGTMFPEAFLSRHRYDTDVLQSFFLMEQFVLGQDSWWSVYISSLPTISEVDDLQFENDDDSLWVRGTNLDLALRQQQVKWKTQFEDGNTFLKQLGWRSSIEERYSFGLYRWASTIFGSRSFTSQVLSDTAPADRARPHGRNERDHEMLKRLFSERFAVLLPLLDILNHKPAAQIEWQPRTDFVGLQVLSDYSDGAEIYNNYGPRDNEGLLMSYGFVLEDNPFDHVLLSIPVPVGSPLEVARSWPQDDRTNEHHSCFIFDINHPIVESSVNIERALFSYDLLESISMLCSNEREMQSMYNDQRTLMSSAFPAGFRDYRNVLATIGQIMMDCQGRIGRTQAHDPTRMSPSIQPANAKQRNALIYRQKQVEILRAAAAVCAFVLINASTDQEPADILLTMQMKLPNSFVPELQSLATAKSCMTDKAELLTTSGMIQLLPSPVDQGVRSCWHEVELALVSGSRIATVKSEFAISLSAMCQTFQSGVQLPPRLHTWCEELVQSYPPDDENWSYVPSSGPWTPGEEPPAALMALLRATKVIASKTAPESSTKDWLEPNLICWAWNVMEEEGVRVPAEIERFVSDDPDQVSGPMGFLLYCKQY